MEPNNTAPTQGEHRGDKSIGPAIGIIIIILVMVVGSLYFLSERMKKNTEALTPALQNTEVTPEAPVLEVQATTSAAL